jgi:SAM-dependent methyltransferase
MHLSKFYDRYWQHEGLSPAEKCVALSRRRIKLQKVLTKLPQKSSVLDAGCGNGEISLFLAKLGYYISGTDISVTAVERAKAAVPEGRFEVASLETGLPFKEGEFLAVWCSEVLEHIFDVHAALSELNRVLVLNGFFILTVPYHCLVKNLPIALNGFERHYNPYVSHVRFFTRKSLQICLEHSGFTVISWEGIGRFWPFWMSFFVVARKTALPGPAPEIIG